MAPQKYYLQTLGCKANAYDGELLEAELRRRGWIRATTAGEADLCVVNSCTVTAEADRQSRKLAQRFGRQGAKVVFTGCGAEVSPHLSAGIDFVVSNRDKPGLVDLVLNAIDGDRGPGVLGRAQGYKELRSQHPMDRDWPLPEMLPAQGLQGSQRTRVFLKIQEGCNSFCTFCVIPYGRGPSRSLRPRQVVEQIRQLVAAGTKEVVLTATNLGDYGVEWAPKGQALEELTSHILQTTALPRLRVSSLDPTEITPGLLQLVEEEPRFCPHFHVSLQSPHSKILKLMKRKYGHGEVRDCLEAIGRLRSDWGPVFVGMDLITGFPGESAEVFDESVAMLASLPWTRLHVFPFSEREGTPATRLKNSVPLAERKRRVGILGQLSMQRLRSFYTSALGKKAQVLVEGRAPQGFASSTCHYLAGYTPNYLRVFTPKTTAKINSFFLNIPKQLSANPSRSDFALMV